MWPSCGTRAAEYRVYVAGFPHFNMKLFLLCMNAYWWLSVFFIMNWFVTWWVKDRFPPLWTISLFNSILLYSLNHGLLCSFYKWVLRCSTSCTQPAKNTITTQCTTRTVLICRVGGALLLHAIMLTNVSYMWKIPCSRLEGDANLSSESHKLAYFQWSLPGRSGGVASGRASDIKSVPHQTTHLEITTCLFVVTL